MGNKGQLNLLMNNYNLNARRIRLYTLNNKYVVCGRKYKGREGLPVTGNGNVHSPNIVKLDAIYVDYKGYNDGW